MNLQPCTLNLTTLHPVHEAEHMPKLMLDKSIYNDALESSALNDDVYTRSRMSCDDDSER